MIKKTGAFMALSLLSLLFSGCAFNEMATKGDVNQMQGSINKRQSMLSEDVIALKSEVRSLRLQVKDMMYTTEKDLQSSKKNIQILNSQLTSLQREVSSLGATVDRMKKEDIPLLSKDVNFASSKISKIQKGLEKKIDIILEEVTAENARLSAAVSSLQRRRSNIKRGSAKKPLDGIHVVESGESLSIIAHRYGVTTEELASYNDIDDPSTIYAGQELKIPE